MLVGSISSDLRAGRNRHRVLNNWNLAVGQGKITGLGPEDGGLITQQITGIRKRVSQGREKQIKSTLV